MPTRLAAYRRLSQKSDESVSIASQRTGILNLCRRNGWTEPEADRWYTDDGVSASTVGKRPAFEQLMKAVADGEVDAIVCRDDDRFVRHPMELETIIPVLEARRVPVYFTNASDIDLTTPDGRMHARIKGAVARAEVEKKSMRQKASNVERASKGSPYMPGFSPFGYRKANGTLEVIPEQAEAIRWAVDLLLAGGTRATVMRRWNELGLRTNKSNKPWSLGAVRVALTNYTIAGKRRYQKTSILSDAPQSAPEILDGSWEPIIPWEKFQALLIVLEPDKSKSAGNKVRYLGTGIYRCGDCGEPKEDAPAVRDYDGRQCLPFFRAGWRAWKTKAGEQKRARIYVCQSCGKSISRADEIDEHLEAKAKESLRLRAIYSQLFGAPEGEVDLDSLDIELKKLDEQEEALADALLAGHIRRAVFEPRAAKIAARRDEIQKSIAAGDVEKEAFNMFVDPETADAQWDGSSIEVKREMLNKIYRRVWVYPSRKREDIERLVETDSYVLTSHTAADGSIERMALSGDTAVSEMHQTSLFDGMTKTSLDPSVRAGGGLGREHESAF